MVLAPARPSPGEVVSSADQRVILYNVPWSHYEVMLALRGESAVPKLTYLDGALEIMSPSQDHERLKSRLGRLVEVYLLHHEITFEALGAWTLKHAPELRGAEPDECYKIGEDLSGDRPHLAIEVIWTSGGLDKLAIYNRLKVPEVWIWKEDQITAYLLEGGEYRASAQSALLPGFDFTRAAELMHAPSASAAIKAYRAELEGR